MKVIVDDIAQAVERAVFGEKVELVDEAAETGEGFVGGKRKALGEEGDVQGHVTVGDCPVMAGVARSGTVSGE